MDTFNALHEYNIATNNLTHSALCHARPPTQGIHLFNQLCEFTTQNVYC